MKYLTDATSILDEYKNLEEENKTKELIIA